MTLRAQLNLVVLTVVSICAAALFLGLAGFLRSGLRGIEISLAEQDLHRIEAAYRHELAAMDMFARDWAWWDDSCRFMTTTDETFIAANLNYETIHHLDLDYMGYVRLTGEVVYGVRYDRQHETLTEWPASFREHLQAGGPLLNFRNPRDEIGGVIFLPEGPALVVARHILHSDGSLPMPPFGAFVVARLLDEEKTAEWSCLLGVHVNWRPSEKISPSGSLKEVGDKADKPYSRRGGIIVGRANVAGFVELRDLYGRRVGGLCMTKPRAISRGGYVLLAQFAFAMLSLMGMMFVAITWSVRRYVVAPVSELSMEIERIAAKPDFQDRVHLPKGPELSLISRSVNHLLEAISAAEAAQARRERFIRQLTQCILQFGPDIDGNIRLLVKLLGEMLNADCALYNRLKGALLCTMADWHAPDDLQREGAPEGHLCFDVITRGNNGLLVVRDLQHSTYAVTDPNVRKYGLQTYIGHAVFCGGQAIGAVCVVFTRDVELSADEQDFIGIVAVAISVEEARRAAESRLKESHEEWRRTFDFVPDAICILDNQFRMERVNAKMAELLGMPSEQIVGQTCYECVHGGNAPHPSCPHARVLETGKAQSAEIREERLGGEFYVTCAPMFDEHGQVVGSIHVARDIGALKERERKVSALLAESDQMRLALLSVLEDVMRTQEALRRSEARFRDLVRLLPGIVFETDAHGRITFANEFAFRHFGYVPEDLEKGFTIYDVVVPEQHPLLEKTLTCDFAGHRADELTLRRKDGTTCPAAVYSVRVVQEGQFMGLRMIGVDLTEHKRIENLRVAKEAAERADRAKSELLALMSHELRTPIHAMAGFARAALDGVYGPLSEPIREILSQILEAADQLMGLINDVLDMARLDLGKVTLALGEVNVSRAVQDCVRLVRGRIEASGLKFETAFAPGTENLRIVADERRVKQILLNLLSNSIKFTPSGGWIRVEVGLQNESQMVRFAVTDSGPGVASENLARIFERFERICPPDGRWREGTGLGLAVAKELTALHGGQIWAECEDEGAGLRVIFELPVNGPPVSSSLT